VKLTAIFIITLLLFATSLCGQTRVIEGLVISERLEPLAFVHIQDKNSILLGKTDLNGRFKFEIPQQTETLFLSSASMERAIIKLKNDCDTFEIIMLLAGSYDFMSPKKIDKDRLKRFNKLSELHLTAYEKKLFSNKAICYINEFVPDKPRVDEIQRQMISKQAKLKLSFEKLKIRDTIKIPFKIQDHGTDWTTLFAYSAFPNYTTYDCIITGIVIEKNKKHKGYNLVYKVIKCNNCKPSSIYNGKTMKIDKVFAHNMKYFKVIFD
jgi:hypothetical protein